MSASGLIKTGALSVAALSKSVAGNANVTLSPSEARNGIFTFTGILTGAVIVYIPFAGPGQFIVKNGTTGAYTLTIAGVGGSGVIVQLGVTEKLYTVDGLAVLRLPDPHSTIRRLKVPLVATDSAGDTKIANPEGVTCIVHRAIVDVTTVATSAGTLDVGVAANGTTLDDTLIDGLDVHTAAVIADNLLSPGSNGKAVAKWTSSQFITASKASGALAGMVGSLYVDYSIA